MEKIILEYAEKKYTEKELLAAVGKIAAAVKMQKLRGETVAINVTDTFVQTAAVVASWSLGMGVYLINSEYPSKYRNELALQYAAKENCINDEFIRKAWRISDPLNISPVWTGKLLFEQFDGKRQSLGELSAQEMADRFAFMRNELKLCADRVYIQSQGSLYLRFFALSSGGTAVFDSENFSENSCVILPSYQMEKQYKKLLNAKVSAVVSLGEEVYSQDIRNKLKQAGVKVYNIFDMPTFRFITSGTDSIAVPVKGVKTAVLNAAGVHQAVGMKGYVYIERENTENQFSGYECVVLANRKYKLSRSFNKAYAKGEYLIPQRIETLLKEQGDTVIYENKVENGEMHVYLDSKKKLSELGDILSEQLPDCYDSVVLIKASSAGKKNNAYTSTDIKALKKSLAERNVCDITLDAAFDEDFTIVLEGNSASINAADQFFKESNAVKKAIFQNTENGERIEHRYFEFGDTEKKVLLVFRDILGDNSFGFFDDFFEHGGTSLLFIKLCYALEETTGKKVNSNEFFVHAAPNFYCSMVSDDTLDALAAERQEHREESMDEILIRDSQLNPLIPDNEEPKERGILLTGATGFLGTFLLASLLEKTSSKIYCLVRAANREEGMERIHVSLKKYNLERYCGNPKIQIVIGDLEKKHLGMSDQAYQHILYHTDQIVHNGAKVDFMYTYDMLKKTNVDSVHEIIDIAAQGARKEIHYISTLAVLEDSLYQGNADEDFDNSKYPPAIFGYNQSKWVGDVCIQKAMQYGIKANIYRIATASGDSVFGNWQSNDLVRSVCKLCLQIGSTPKFEHILHLVPVDRLAGLIAYCINDGIQDKGKILHLGGGREINVELLVQWINAYDLSLKIEEEDSWMKQAAEYVVSHKDRIKDNAIFGIISRGFGFDFGAGFGCNILTEKSDRYFESLGLKYSAVTQGEFDKCLKSIKQEIDN